jgi:hypothetical protein
MEFIVGQIILHAPDLLDSIDTGFFKTAEEALADFIMHHAVAARLVIDDIEHGDGASDEEREQDVDNVLYLKEWEVTDDTSRN